MCFLSGFFGGQELLSPDYDDAAAERERERGARERP